MQQMQQAPCFCSICDKGPRLVAASAGGSGRPPAIQPLESVGYNRSGKSIASRGERVGKNAPNIPIEELEYANDLEKAYGVSDDLLEFYRCHQDNLRRFDTFPHMDESEVPELGLLARELDVLRESRYDPTAEDAVFKAARVDFVHSTARLEGNTLSVGDVALILGEDAVIANKSFRDHQEVADIDEAFSAMVGYLKDRRQIDVDLIRDIHRIAARHLPDCEEGELRYDQRYVVGSAIYPPPPSRVRVLLEGAIEWYREKPSVVRAAGFHLLFEDIHPFQDGNGRCGRILLNYMLMELGYPVIALKCDREHAIEYHRIVSSFAADIDRRDSTAMVRLVVEALQRATSQRVLQIEQVREQNG